MDRDKKVMIFPILFVPLHWTPITPKYFCLNFRRNKAKFEDHCINFIKVDNMFYFHVILSVKHCNSYYDMKFNDK